MLPAFEPTTRRHELASAKAVGAARRSPGKPNAMMEKTRLVAGFLRLLFALPMSRCGTRWLVLDDRRSVSHNAAMNESPPQDPRRRLRELLSIPERDRSDPQWDEIIELEITLAPGNRESDRNSDRLPGQPEKRQNTSGPGRRPDQRKTGPRPAGPPRQQDQRQPAARAETASPEGGAADGRSPDSRPPAKRHGRRPRRPPEAPSDG